MTYTSYALWGRGDVTPQNASALLADYLNGQVGAIYRPVDVPRGGLRNAINFLETPEMYGDGGTIESEDVINSLLVAQEEEGDDIVLIALVPGDATVEEVHFLQGAASSGIRVVNLSGGLDDVDTDNLEAVVPEPVKKTRASRKLSDPKPVAEDMGTTSPATAELKAAFDAEVAAARQDPPWVVDAQEIVVQTEALDASGMIELADEQVSEVETPENSDEPVYMILESQEPHRIPAQEYVADTMLTVALREMVRQEIYSILKDEGILPGSRVDTIDDLKAEVARLRDIELAKKESQKFSDHTSKPQVMGKDYDDPEIVDHVVSQMSKQFDETTGKIDYYMTQDGMYRLAAEGLPRRGEIIAPLAQHEVNALTREGRIK